MADVYKILILLGAVVAGGAVLGEVGSQFSVQNVSNIDPGRYHALGLFNNDHPSRKRLAVRSMFLSA